MKAIGLLPGLDAGGCIDDGIVWYSGRVSSDAGWLTHAAGLLSSQERARARRFVSTSLSNSYVGTRGLVRTAVARHLGLDASSVVLCEGRRGKPYVEGAPGFSFNLSHTSDRWLLAVSHRGQVGVDVELLASGAKWEDLAASVFHASELGQLRSRDVEMNAEMFVRGWTRKEAVLKAIGVGLHESPICVRTDLTEVRQDLEFHSDGAAWRLRVHDLPIGAERCRASLAWVRWRAGP